MSLQMSSIVATSVLVDIVHLHTFKCAGTTFAWILEKCFPDQLLYVESTDPGSRLDWRKVADLNLNPYRAITSHLIDCPPTRCLSRLKVAFVREPLQRFRSAYFFLKDVQKKLAPETTSKSYMTSQATTIISNFQARHLSPQGDEGFDARQGWQLRPDLIDLCRLDFFVGVVERFDESLVVLEHLLSSMGSPLDLSYPQPMNTSNAASGVIQGEDSPPSWIVNQLETDHVLWQQSNARLDERIRALPGFPSRLSSFRSRCNQLAEEPALTESVRVHPPRDWTYLA